MWVMWQAVPEDKRYDMYRLYIKKVSSRSHVKPGLGQSGAKGPRFWGAERAYLCVWICVGGGAVRRDQDEGGVRACHRGAARRPGQEDVPRVRRGREEARRGQSDRQTYVPFLRHQSKPHAHRRRAGLFLLNGKDAGAELVCRLCLYICVQIDRARGVFIHGANMADPKRDPGYWKKWQVRACISSRFAWSGGASRLRQSRSEDVLVTASPIAVLPVLGDCRTSRSTTATRRPSETCCVSRGPCRPPSRRSVRHVLHRLSPPPLLPSGFCHEVQDLIVTFPLLCRVAQVNYMAAEMVSGETVTSDAEALAREQSKQPQAMGTLGSGTAAAKQ